MAKTTELLQNTQVVISAGTRPYEERSISKWVTTATGTLVLAMGLLAGSTEAQAQQYSQLTPQQQAASLSQRIPAQVVSVKKIQPTQYEREQERLRRRTEAASGRVVDRLIGAVLREKVDYRYRSTARDFTNIATDMGQNRISQWRNNGQNSAYSSPNVMVTVDVRLPGRAPHRFEIVQSAAVGVKKGDNVYLMPTANGGVAIVPMEYRPSASVRIR